MYRKEKILEIPGPTEVALNVLDVMSHPLIAHYMDDWVELYKDVIGMLRRVFKTEGSVFLITGSGSAGLEAAIASTVETGDKVVADKYFNRYVEVYGGRVIPVDAPFGEAVTADHIEEILRREGDVKVVALAHNNSGTSVTNPIDEIGKTVSEYGALFVVDAVSSLGGIDVRFDEWSIDLCCGATQKALAVPPGLAPVAVSDKAWETMEKRKEPIKSVYLNLMKYREASKPPMGKFHPTPHTPSTVLVLALLQSLKNILNEGLENVYKRHAVASKAVREGLKSLGLKLVVKDERYASNTVTAIRWPENYDYNKFWYTLYNKYNIMIGNPPIQSEVWPESRGCFRIGHMGNTASIHYILPTFSYIEFALRDVGYAVKEGELVKVAQKIFATHQ